MSSYHLSIITPQGKQFEGQVDSLMAPGVEGSFGVLASHAPFISALKDGVLTLIQNGAKRFFAISSGVLEVNPKGSVLILSDSAVDAKTLEDAEDKLKNPAALK